MKPSKILAPVVFGALTLAGAQAQAENTVAGVEIENTATLEYAVNGAAQAEVTAKKAFRVDVKLIFDVKGQSNLQNTSTRYALDGTNEDYYLLGIYDVANTGNVKARFDLSIANVSTGAIPVIGNDDTKDFTETQTLRFFRGTGIAPADEITAAQPLDIEKAPDNSNGTKQEVRVYVHKADIVGVDADIIGAALTASVTQVAPKNADNSDGAFVDITTLVANNNTDDIEAVIADDGLDNTEVGYNGIALQFPDLGNGNGDGGTDDSGNFTKTSQVISDPFGKTFPEAKAVPGAVVEYTITVKNTGSIDAESVEITDPIPANTTYVANSVAAFEADGSTALAGATATFDDSDSNNKKIVVNLGTLGGGATAADQETNVIKFQVTVD